MLAKQSQSNVKLNNLRLILNTIIQHEPLSRADLVRFTQISKPTVSNLVDELITRNLIREIGAGPSQTGRKPILLKFNSTLKYFLVFNTGRADYHVALADLKGVILAEQNGEFTLAQTYQERLAVLCGCMHALLDQLQLEPTALLKIHGGAPGVYVGPGQALKWSGVAIPEDRDMQTCLEQAFQTPVILNHSSKLALLGEKIAGKAQAASHVIYIDWGYGLGGAFLFNDRLYFGATNSAGEIGYIYSDLKEFDAYHLAPYKDGALEALISGGALQKIGLDYVKKQNAAQMLALVKGDATQITAKVIFTAARQGDPQAYFILKDAFRYFNLTLCNIINMLNPELVILGGGISNAGDFLLEFITGEIQDKVLMMPQFAISDLQNKATVIGAIAYLIEHTDFLHEL
jgi:predicted NBD/HSP70 family sugar kinase